MSLETLKLKQQGTTAHLSEWPKPIDDIDNKCWQKCGAIGTLIHCCNHYGKQFCIFVWKYTIQ